MSTRRTRANANPETTNNLPIQDFGDVSQVELLASTGPILDENRRRRIPWSKAEEEQLKEGVRVLGAGNWNQILNNGKFHFTPGRRPVDLKDKWRNITQYTRYTERPLRTFLLLDDNDRPLLQDSGRPYLYRNRWPRDAASKAATKGQFYPSPNHTGPITINVREVFLDGDQEWRTRRVSDLISAMRQRPNDPIPTVWIYRGTRQKVDATPGVAKFSRGGQVWQASIRRIRTKQLLDNAADIEPVE